MKPLEFIQTVKDDKGFEHSVLILKVKTHYGVWQRVFKYGNITYFTMDEVKRVINS